MQAKKCGLRINEHQEEIANITSSLFPCEIFDNLLSQKSEKELPWHWHDVVELIIVHSGSMTLSCNEENYSIHEQQGAFINSNVLHSASLMESKDCVFDSLLFHPSLIASQSDYQYELPYIEALLHAPITCYIFDPSIAWQSDVLTSISQAFHAYEQESFAYELYVRSRISDIWYNLCHHTLSIQTRKKDSDTNSQRIKTMIRYIQDHHNQSITLHDIANSVSISERECLRCFKKKINSTPMQFVLKYRIQIASHLLENNEQSIATIATDIGFDSPSYFTYVFKRFTSLTPKQYRQAHLLR